MLHTKQISIFLLVCVLGVLSVVPAHAGENTVAAGIMLGSPTGISVLIAHRVAVGAAWSYRNYLHLHGDLWLHTAQLVEPVDWYLGVGAKFRAFSDNHRNKDFPVGVGARLPIGLRYFPIEPLELFLELAPGISVIPKTSPDLDAVIGVRYHF